MSSMEAHDDARQARLVTRNFAGLQGLKLLPWVPAVLMFGGSEAGVLAGSWWLPAFVASLAAAVGGTVLVSRWYDEHYGEVATVWDDRRVRGLFGLAVVVVALWVTTTGLRLIEWPDAFTSGHVAGLGLIAGVAVAAAGWRLRPVSAHAWWFGIVLAVASVAPLGWIIGASEHPLNAAGAPIGVVALLFVVVGLGTHAALSRTLDTEPERT